MILTLFILFLAFALILYFAGRYNNAPYLSIGTSGIVFLLGVVLLFGGVEYYSGSNDVYSYGENSSLIGVDSVRQYSPLISNVVNGVDVLHFFGFLMAVLGIIIFISSMQDLGRLKGEYE